MAPDNDEHIAAVLPDYELGRELGHGQHGTVLAARHRQLGRQVAIKQLVGRPGDEEAAERFRREARILAQLDHPHVVTVHDYREAGSIRLLIMELLTGGTFEDTRVAGMTLETAVGGTMAAASGLHHVHQQGVLHRDVKPQNLMLTGTGVLKVTDFGVARGEAVDQTAVELTEAGRFVGTPAYAAPEQVAEAFATGWPAVGPAADQYALAAVLYVALSGTYPHDASGGFVALAHRRMHEPAIPLASVAPEVPGAVAAVVMRALARDPAERYGSVETFAISLGDATTSALGRGWLDRSAIEIRATGPIRAAAEGRPEGAPAPPRTTAEVHALIGVPDTLAATDALATTTPAAETPDALVAAGPAAAGADGTDTHARTRSPWRWSLVVLPLALALLAALVLLRPGPSTDAAAPGGPGGPGGPGPGTTLPVHLATAWQFTTEGDVFASPLVMPTGIVVGSTDKKLYALDPTTGAQRWKLATEGPIYSSAAASADGRTAFVGSYDGGLYAVDVADGTKRWRADVGFQITSSPAVADELVVVGADALYAFDAASGERRWRAESDDIVSSPAVADRVVYVGTNGGEVLAVDLATGNQRWAYDAGASVVSSPVVRDGVVYVGSNADSVVALDATSGALRWKATVDGAAKSTPAVSGDAVLVGTNGGRLVALDRGDGRPRWSFTAQDRIESSPLLVGSHVVVGSADGDLYVVDVSTGALEGTFDTGQPVLSSPRLAGSQIVVGGYDDKVRALTGLST